MRGVLVRQSHNSLLRDTPEYIEKYGPVGLNSDNDVLCLALLGDYQGLGILITLSIWRWKTTISTLCGSVF